MCETNGKCKYSSELRFQKLTPCTNVNIDVYREAIDFAMSQKDIKNIAVSGAYGAGKSSVLESYKNIHKQKKFVHISLASFHDEQNTNENECQKKVESGNNIENNNLKTYTQISTLEGKILNQLIHQTSENKIPQTNFRMKNSIPANNIYCRAVLLLIAIVIAIYIYKFESLKFVLLEGSFGGFLKFFASYDSFLIAIVVLIILSYVIIYYSIKAHYNGRFLKKLNLQGNEIELFEKSNESYFDKYLNEVLYVFDNTDADVIVFEDIDRFETTKIFERLREINVLTNFRREKTKKNPLKFFYLLRDDIFISKDRTKFFDFIIPVVPVIDGSNSIDMLLKSIKENHLEKDFDEYFLKEMSFYIDDMRLLKNIYNEYLIYYNKINNKNIKFDNNKMLALITYKNIFPNDFAALQLNKGYVYSVFKKKDSLIEILEEKINHEIERKKALLDTKRKSWLQNIDELYFLFGAKYTSHTAYQGLSGVELRNRLNAYLRDSNKQQELAIRENELKRNLEVDTDTINKNIEVLRKQKYDLYKLPFHKLISRENSNFIFGMEENDQAKENNLIFAVKSSEYFDLLVYLISNGYIDEMYPDYMTFFYENSISAQDKNFLRSVVDKQSMNYSYELKNPEKVIRNLRDVFFQEPEILNFSLLDYLLNVLNNSDYINQKKYLFEQLEESKQFDFIGEYFKISAFKQMFVKELNLHWTGFFYEAVCSQKFSRGFLHEYSLLTLCNSSDNSLDEINLNGAVTNFISNEEKYLVIDSLGEISKKKLVNRFIYLNIKFEKLNFEEADIELVRFVYEKGLYVLNKHNILAVFKNVFKISNEEFVKHRNFTILFEYKDSSLYQKFISDMATYFDVVLELCDEKICDEQSVIIDLMNNQDIVLEQKINYLKYNNTELEKLSAFSVKELWDTLIISKQLKYSEENILTYYRQHNAINEQLLEYINRHEYVLNFKLIDNKEEREALFLDVVENNDIIDEVYKEILNSLKISLSNFNINTLSENKVKILIQNNIIKMNMESLHNLRANYSNILEEYISKNINEYIKLLENNTISQEELVRALSWGRISDENKINLVDLANNKIMLNELNSSDAVVATIIEAKKYVPETLLNYFYSYNTYSEVLKKSIVSAAVEEINIITTNIEKIDINLKKELLRSTSVLKEVRVKILLDIVKYLNIEEAKRYLTILDLSDLVKVLVSNKNSIISNTEYNRAFLDAFDNNDWIKSVKEWKEGEMLQAIKR